MRVFTNSCAEPKKEESRRGRTYHTIHTNDTQAWFVFDQGQTNCWLWWSRLNSRKCPWTYWVRQVCERRLEDLDVLVIYLNGLRFGAHHKHVLGVPKAPARTR